MKSSSVLFDIALDSMDMIGKINGDVLVLKINDLYNKSFTLKNEAIDYLLEELTSESAEESIRNIYNTNGKKGEKISGRIYKILNTRPYNISKSILDDTLSKFVDKEVSSIALVTSNYFSNMFIKNYCVKENNDGKVIDISLLVEIITHYYEKDIEGPKKITYSNMIDAYLDLENELFFYNGNKKFSNALLYLLGYIPVHIHNSNVETHDFITADRNIVEIEVSSGQLLLLKELFNGNLLKHKVSVQGEKNLEINLSSSEKGWDNSPYYNKIKDESETKSVKFKCCDNENSLDLTIKHDGSIISSKEVTKSYIVKLLDTFNLVYECKDMLINIDDRINKYIKSRNKGLSSFKRKELMKNIHTEIEELINNSSISPDFYSNNIMLLKIVVLNTLIRNVTSAEIGTNSSFTDYKLLRSMIKTTNGDITDDEIDRMFCSIGQMLGKYDNIYDYIKGEK